MSIDPNTNYETTVTFTASTTSDAVDLGGAKVLAFITPASLGVSALTLQAASTFTGTYLDVYDEAGAAISITVSSSAAGWYDLSDVFPASVRFIKLKAGSSISKTVTLATMPV